MTYLLRANISADRSLLLLFGSDYFNYGFNEVTWSAYCERQRRMRVTEAGVALLAGPPARAPPPDAHLRRMPGGESLPPLAAGQNVYVVY